MHGSLIFAFVLDFCPLARVQRQGMEVGSRRTGCLILLQNFTEECSKSLKEKEDVQVNNRECFCVLCFFSLSLLFNGKQRHLYFSLYSPFCSLLNYVCFNLLKGWMCSESLELYLNKIQSETIWCTWYGFGVVSMSQRHLLEHTERYC